MQSVRWLGFGDGGNTLLHFFPETKGISVPHPVDCKVSVFGSAEGRRSVAFEGATIGEPDGLQLEGAFPELNGRKGLIGIEFEIGTEHKMDISGSRCAIELHGAAGRSVFHPHPVDPEMEPSCALLEGDNNTFVVVNGGASPAKTEIAITTGGREETITLPETNPETVSEFPVQIGQGEASGLVANGTKSAAIRLKNRPPHVAVYLVKRSQNEIVSVGVL